MNFVPVPLWRFSLFSKVGAVSTTFHPELSVVFKEELSVVEEEEVVVVAEG